MNTTIDATKLLDEVRGEIERMAEDHVLSGGPGPLFNAGWQAACNYWAKRLRAVIERTKDDR